MNKMIRHGFTDTLKRAKWFPLYWFAFAVSLVDASPSGLLDHFALGIQVKPTPEQLIIERSLGHDSPFLSVEESGNTIFMIESSGNIQWKGQLNPKSVTVSGNIEPAQDGHSLGSTLKPWRDLYALHIYVPQKIKQTSGERVPVKKLLSAGGMESMIDLVDVLNVVQKKCQLHEIKIKKLNVNNQELKDQLKVLQKELEDDQQHLKNEQMANERWLKVHSDSEAMQEQLKFLTQKLNHLTASLKKSQPQNSLEEISPVVVP